MDSVDEIFRSVVLPILRRLNSLGELTFNFLSLMIKNQKNRTSLQILAQKGFGILLFQTEKINDLDGGLIRFSITRVKSLPTKDSNDFEDTLLTRGRAFSKRI